MHIRLLLLGLLISGLFSCQLGESRYRELGEKTPAGSKPMTLADTASEIVHVKNPTQWKSGDIIFHTSTSSQSKAIQYATHSRYSHMGIIFQENEEWFVLEAIQPVQATRIRDWIKRGEKGEYAIKRLKQYPDGPGAEQIEQLALVARGFYGKNYDLYFGWGDGLIYCSELVWKVYHRGLGIKLCELKELKTFDLSHELVKKKMKERYGGATPLTEKVVSPEDIFQSELLMGVGE
jgi:hypothetical protein